MTDYLDGDAMVQYLIETAGLPARIIRGSEQVAQIRQQQAEAAQQQQAMQEQMQSAEAANKIAPFIKAAGSVPVENLE